MMLQRTRRDLSSLFQRWRWRGPQFQIHPLQFHLLLPRTAPETAGPSSTSQQSSEHVPISSKELSAIMDVVCALATTQALLDERMARAEVTLTQNHAMLLRIMSHLGLPPISVTEPT